MAVARPLGYDGQTVPRWSAIILVGALVLGVSGVLPAAAAAGDCCGEAGANGAADPCGPEVGGQGHRADRDDHDDRDRGGAMGCPPLCSACVCAAYFAPVMLTPAPVLWIDAVGASRTPPLSVWPESVLRTDVFHPPRAA